MARKKKIEKPNRAPRERTKVLRAISENALMNGVKPIEVMLSNMRFYHVRAEAMTERIVEVLSQQRGLSKEEFVETVKTIGKMNEYRELATNNAAQAAPYVHPRLSAIAVNVTNESRKQLPPGMSLDEALALYEENTRRFPTKAPHQLIDARKNEDA